MTEDGIGVDISKDQLDCHRLSDGTFEQFPNIKPGFQKLRRWIGPDLPARVVFGPTGPYHGSFEAALADHLPLVKVNQDTPVVLRKAKDSWPRQIEPPHAFWHRWGRRMHWSRMCLSPRIVLFSESYRPPAPH